MAILASSGQSPYSWPPELARTDRFWPLGYSRPAYCSKAENSRFSCFLVFLNFSRENREAATNFRPVYCSIVFHMSTFLDVFSGVFSSFPCFLVSDPRTL